jgi:hypothetical protein
MSKKPATAAEKEYELHHIREGQGMSQRASNYMVVPLCPDCHRGPLGIHGNKAMLNMMKLGELDLLAMTVEKVFRRLKCKDTS